MSQMPQNTPPRRDNGMDELWRFALGYELRRMRIARGERLDDTAVRAGISPQYLSEIERGRKDASSEMIAAVIGALESNLVDVLVRVARELDSGNAAIIDIRSLTRLTERPDQQPTTPANLLSSGVVSSEVVLSLAA